LFLNSNYGGSADGDSTESFHDVQEAIYSDEEDDTLLDLDTTSSVHQHQVPEQLSEEYNSELLACFRRVWDCGELYKGAGPLAWTLATSNFVFFFINAFIKGKLTARCRSKSLPSHLSLLASCLAGSVNVLLTNPLWVTNFRIINGVSQHDSLWKELIHVAQTLGPLHLWQGTTASLLLVSNPVIQFFCYEQIKSIQLGRIRRTPTTQRERLNLTPAEAFLFGAFAKAIATLATYPLQLAQAVLRMQKKGIPLNANATIGTTSTEEARKVNGTLGCILSIFERDSFRGLFTGLRAKMLQSVLTAAFTFLTYEQILGAVSTVHRRFLTAKTSTA
jgi:adenine nucleotide transporter 17